MIFELLAPPWGPRGWSQKCAVAQPFMCVRSTPNLAGFRPMVKEEIA